MFSKHLIIFVQAIFLSVTYAAIHLPPIITKCNKAEPNFEDCMVNSMTEAMRIFKNGSKEFGIPKLEPFYVERLELTADPEKSVRLNQKYEHVNMYGIADSKITKFKMSDDGTNCDWEVEVFSPQTVMEADYQLTGQVLVFPINGHGKCNVTLIGISAKHKSKCEHYMKKGKSHLRLSGYTMSMKPKECHFDFPNIIPGNEQISREVGKTVNENSLEIFEDVKGGFEKMLSRVHEAAANSVFSKIPEEELFGS